MTELNNIDNLDIDTMSTTCRDSPKDTDRQYSKILEWEDDLPDKVFYKAPIENQFINRNPKTNKWCTRFAMSYIINALNILEWSDVRTTGEQLRYNKKDRDYNKWDTLQSALDEARELWYIEWYSKVQWDYQLKKALSEWKLIYTGSSRCSWALTNKDKVFTPINYEWLWHWFNMCWYDELYYYWANSFWKNRWDNWFFKIKHEDIKYLFTTYAIMDKKDVDLMKKQISKDKKDIELAVSLGITNWQRLKENITREEAVLLVIRTMNILLKDIKTNKEALKLVNKILWDKIQK